MKKYLYTLLLIFFSLAVFAEENDRRPILGALMYFPNEYTADYLDLPKNEGVYLTAVLPSSALDLVGLKRGDFLLGIDGKKINHEGYVEGTGVQIGDYVIGKEIDSYVTIKARSEGEIKTIRVKLVIPEYYDSDAKPDYSKLTAEEHLLLDEFLNLMGVLTAPGGYEAAILRGHERALYGYSVLLDKKSKLYNPKRYKEFADYLIDTHGCEKCYALLAMFYESEVEGYPDTPDLKKVQDYTIRAANAGLPMSQYFSVNYFINGGLNLEPDIQKGIALKMKAAEGGYVLAVREVATAQVFGGNYAIPKSNENAHKILKNYFEQYPTPFTLPEDMQYLYGRVLYESQNPEDLKLSLALLRNASLYGESRADLFLALQAKFNNERFAKIGGMPAEVWYYLKAYRDTKRENALWLVYEALLRKWDELSDPLKIYNELLPDVKKNYKNNEKFSYWFWGDWLIKNKGTISDTDVADGLEILKEISASGDLEATRSLMALMNQIENQIPFDDELFTELGNRVMENGDINEGLRYAFFRTRKVFPYYDFNKGIAVYEHLLKKDKSILPRMLQDLIFQGTPGEPHPYKDKILALIEDGMKLKLNQQENTAWIKALWSVEWHFELPSEAKEHLWQQLSKSENRTDLELEFRYFQMLTDRNGSDVKNILSQYDLLKNAYIEANIILANKIIDGGISLDAEFALAAFKKALHLFLNKKAVDLAIYDKNLFALQFIEQGVALAVPQGDLDAALYFHDAYMHVINESKSTIDPQNFELLLNVGKIQAATLLAESGDLSGAYDVAVNALKMASSPAMNKLGFGPRLGVIYQAAAILINLKEYKLITDAFTDILKDVDLEKDDKNLVSYAALMGQMYSLYQQDEELANSFKTFQVLTDEEIIQKNPQIVRTVIGAQVYRHVFFEKDFDTANKIIKAFRREAMKSSDKIRHWEIQYFQMLSDFAEKNGGGKYTSKWRSYAADLYLSGMLDRVKNKRIITPREKIVVSNFIYDLAADDGVDRDLVFRIYQLAQGMAVSRAIDARELSANEKKQLFAHSDYSKDSSLLADDEKLDIDLLSERDVRLKLEDDQALVSNIVSEKGVLTWVFTNEFSKVLFNQVTRDSVLEAKEKLENSLSKGSFSYESSGQLYKSVLMDSVLVLPKHIKHLLVSPSLELSSLPPSVFVTSLDGDLKQAVDESPGIASRGFGVKRIDSSLKKTRWLIEDYALSITPSLRLLEESESLEDTKNMKFLGIGAPILGEKSQKVAKRNLDQLREGGRFTSDDLHKALVELPEAEVELKLIAKEFSTSKLLLREKATEDDFIESKPSGYDVISFASHALKFDELSDTNEPSIVLTQSVKNDGLLTLTELLGLSLPHTKLVMLSACNTASAAEHLKYEGFSGLTSAFLAAGAKGVLVSHWSVYSQAATDITTNMFKSKKNSFAKKLQESIVRLINGPTEIERSPAYWGAFSLVGN